MYFYNSLLVISNILIFLSLHTQSQNIKGPDPVSCVYNGNGKTICGFPEVKVEDTPEECSSIVFDGVWVNSKYNISSFYDDAENNKRSMENLNAILECKKRTFIYYGRVSYEEWTAFLANDTCTEGKSSLDEMKALKVFLDEHTGITGLIITDLQYYDPNSVEFPGYSENLKKYLEVMRTQFPSLEIGIDLHGNFLIDQFTKPAIPWLDIGVIAPTVDFFVIGLFNMNDCSEDLRYTGISPITSSTAKYTIDQIKAVLTKAPFPKEKTIFKFDLSPYVDPKMPVNPCDSTIDQICLNPADACSWCFEDQTSFNEKGKFSKEFGVGFMVDYIDYNDPTNLCKCEKPYNSFYAILDGYNGVTSKTCDLLIRKEKI